MPYLFAYDPASLRLTAYARRGRFVMQTFCFEGKLTGCGTDRLCAAFS